MARRARSFAIAFTAALVATVPGLTATAAPGPDGSAPIVEVAQGKIKGLSGADADRFLGIPYAAPPTGPRRWAPPAPPARWRGLRDAAQMGSRCPQNAYVGAIEYRNEDCLFLNVYRPHGDAAKKPVFVFIHGGALVRGSSDDVDGGELARMTGAVVVTINYRVGVLGFASTPELDREAGANSGNYGIMDQRAALQWVRANIAAFGGDPGNVTLSGQSSGAMSAWIHLVSPLSRGLFHKAVMMSTAGKTRLMTSAEEQVKGPSAKLAERLGCGDSDDVLACMRSKSTSEVLKVGGFTPATPWTAVIDGAVLSASIGSLIESGRAMNVPIISGLTSQEGGFTVQRRRVGGQSPWTPEDFDKSLAGLPEAVRAAYPVTNYPSPDDADIAVSTDGNACAMAKLNRQAAAQGNPVYSYEFDDRGAPSTIFVDPSRPVGSYHTFDMPYFFQSGMPHDMHPDMPKLNVRQKALADRMVGDIKAFVWTGQPGPAGRWRPGRLLRLNPDGDTLFTLEAFAAEHHCGIWDESGKFQW